MIVAIRIRGMVDLNEDVKSTLDKLRLRRKYACVILDDKSPVIMGMVKKIRSFIAYGEVDEATLKDLIEKRGQAVDKKEKIDVDKVVGMILKQKNMNDLEIKPFFRLHPPRGGINSKQHYPKGVLGSHGKDMSKLIKRML